jgi:hypothetical protein
MSAKPTPTIQNVTQVSTMKNGIYETDEFIAPFVVASYYVKSLMAWKPEPMLMDIVSRIDFSI